MRIFCGLLFILAFTSPGAAKDKAPAKAVLFPQQESDLKPDPAARFGQLENGVRYVVLTNREPRDRASLRLLVIAGSLDETENQRGLAHFLEHMAFNGSKHYPLGKLVEFFQRMGLSFGADVSANTSFNRTIYHLELAHADNPTVLEAMRVSTDHTAAFLPTKDPLAQQRALIPSPKRSRDSSAYRQPVSKFEAMLATTLLPKRPAIGVPE